MELSSVRLMIADGGNRDEGERKEKNDRKAFDLELSDDSVAVLPGSWERTRLRKVSRVEKAMKPRNRRVRRIGGILKL